MSSEGWIARRDATSHPASEDRRDYSANAWESQQTAERLRIKAQIRGPQVPLRFTAKLRPTLDARCEPRFGLSVLRLQMECGVGAVTGGSRECQGCCERWARNRSVVAVGVVEPLNFEGGGLVGLCPESWDRPDRLRIAIAGFKRDFGLASIEVASIHDGNRT